MQLPDPLADPLERLFSLETFGIKLGLENIGRLCEALGHPERSFPTVHIAGTNGKGSVTAMVHASLLRAGYRAARYTSPHLTDLAERFVIGGEPVDPAALAHTSSTVLSVIDRLLADGGLSSPPTFFEATTAIAFELFRRAGVEIAVIEVGLGGRFDATNVIAPIAGAITSIAFDHQQQLGDTLGAIAFEKAGIIKPGLSVVVGALPAEALAAVRRVALERAAELIEASDGSRVEAAGDGGRAEIQIVTPDGTYGPLTLSLRGHHQTGNALVAVRLLEVVRRLGLERITTSAIERGLSTTEWPGRLEQVIVSPNRRVILDAAHNVEGAEALARYLAERHPEKPALVISVMRDKDIDGILRALLPASSLVIATAAPSPRAMNAAELGARIAALATGREVQIDPNPQKAVERALGSSATVCVAGSIFLVGAVRDALRAHAILH